MHIQNQRALIKIKITNAVTESQDGWAWKGPLWGWKGPEVTCSRRATQGQLPISLSRKLLTMSGDGTSTISLDHLYWCSVTNTVTKMLADFKPLIFLERVSRISRISSSITFPRIEVRLTSLTVIWQSFPVSFLPFLPRSDISLCLYSSAREDISIGVTAGGLKGPPFAAKYSKKWVARDKKKPTK